MNGEDTITPESTSGASNRRGALAALLAGSALGLAALGRHSPRPMRKRRKNNGGKKARVVTATAETEAKGERNGGKGNGGNGGNGGDGNGGGQGSSLPSVRFVETTTTFTNSGVVSAFSKCPDGYLPISAGFFSSAPVPQLLTSTPRLAENDWEIEIAGANNSEQITVTVICLAANDDTTAADAKDSAGNRRTRKRSREKASPRARAAAKRPLS